GRAKKFKCQTFGYVESPAFRCSHESNFTIGLELRCRRYIGSRRQVWINDFNLPAVETAECLRPIIEANHADVNVGLGENPVAVTLGKEDVASVFDAFKRFPVCSAANPLGCQQSGPLALAVFDLLPRLFKPVTAKVRFR